MQIRRARVEDIKSAFDMFDSAIKAAFIKEGIADEKEEINKEITIKQNLFKSSVIGESNHIFLVATIGGDVIGTISYGEAAKDIVLFYDDILSNVGELGTIYVDPIHQGKGVASKLINQMMRLLQSLNVDKFILDCGFTDAQNHWIRKFGKPFLTIKNYWGKGSDHMVWYCKNIDEINKEV